VLFFAQFPVEFSLCVTNADDRTAGAENRVPDRAKLFTSGAGSIRMRSGRQWNQQAATWGMVMMDESVRLRRAEDITYQSLGPGEDTVILRLGTGQLHTCNETTRAFLDALDEPRAFKEVFDRLYEQYEVPPEKLRADMMRLLEDLLRAGIVVAES
jgi:hypothetical protein